MHVLPPECTVGMDIWTSRVPLLCFHVVEWHYPDRVRRQFGWYQCIPQDPLPDYGTHTTALRGMTDTDWNVKFHQELNMWNNRREHFVTTTYIIANQHYHSQYGDWYRQRTRRFITIAGAARARSVCIHILIAYLQVIAIY